MTTLLSNSGSARAWKTFVVAGCALGAAAFSCSEEAPVGRSQTSNTSGAGASNTTSPAGIANSSGSIQMTTNNNSGVGGTNPRDTVCDDQNNCTCINIGMLGRLPSYGAVPGQDGTSALEAWLNANSSAQASTYVTKPALNEEFFANYDVLILQALETQEGAGNQWQFSAEEIAAFEAWVRAGGGVIALMGYGADPSEASPTNSLLGFSGLQYAGLTGPGDTSLEGSCPDSCCYCLGNSIPSTGFDPTHPISASLTAVGSYYGRSVSVPADGQVVASNGGKVLGATVQVDNGFIFAFHDEWVTYTSQWDGTGLEEDCLYDDPNNACDQVHPANDYQVPQFWYNALRWASGNIECFDIDIDVIIK